MGGVMPPRVKKDSFWYAGNAVYLNLGHDGTGVYLWKYSFFE